jgi:Flp pilus assembly pilin Flp
MASLIADIIITAISTLGNNMSTMFDAVAGKINTTIPE